MDHRRGVRRLTASRPPASVHVRPFEAADLPVLHAIEARAAALFADHGFPQVGGEPAPWDDFAALVTGNATLVAADSGDKPLGYAVSGPVGDVWWLKELSVDPDVMGTGIGTALLESVAGQARAAGFRQIGLSTFRAVPFNAPFYARRGYRAVDPASLADPIRRQFRGEVPKGVDIGDRVLMIRGL